MKVGSEYLTDLIIEPRLGAGGGGDPGHAGVNLASHWICGGVLTWTPVAGDAKSGEVSSLLRGRRYVGGTLRPAKLPVPLLRPEEEKLVLDDRPAQVVTKIVA